MLVELKRVLDKYTEEELKNMDLWIDAQDEIKLIAIENNAITLVTEEGLESLQIRDKVW